ncbi:MAG TPA: metallophosphoesterase [Candidatus Limnocylindria bacterium]|nr:metallophosphoesterase [Candidatus Limnocylindria bacterium]
MPLVGGRTRGKQTKVFFATDVHGSERTWRKFLSAAKFYAADVLVMGGDVMGKLAVPVIREKNGHHRATIHGRVEQLDTAAEVEQAREIIGGLGFYDVVMDEDEYRTVRDDPAAIDELWRRLATERLARWIELTEDRLGPAGIRCFVSGGNDDLLEVMEWLPSEGTRSFTACESRVVPLDDDHVMVSLPYVNPTPWHTPREAPEEELAAMIDRNVEGITDFGNVVFNFHAPPIDSTLDTCPMLDATTDPPSQVVRGGQPVLYGAGSTAVRAALERYQPLLGLHGHIHESQAAARLGRTLCINPGSEYGEGVLRGTLVNLVNGKVDSYQMTTG